MLIHALRAMFVLLIGAVALGTVGQADASAEVKQISVPLAIAALLVASVIVGVDVFMKRKSLAALSGGFLGLIVGMVVAYGLGLILDMFVQTYATELTAPIVLYEPRLDPATHRPLTDSNTGEVIMHRVEVASAGARVIGSVKLMLGIVCCYLAISFVLQTKDDIRFVIPYVEFAKQTKGARPMILDTSVIIDGRIADICDTRIIDSSIVIPRFVLQELQAIADSSDKLKRNRGRRGLDMLNKLQTNDKVEIRISDTRLSAVEEAEDVDQKLVTLAKKVDGRLVTNDFNLNKIAQLRGVDVININDLANALKPVVMPGEALHVMIIKPGEEPGQGIGYLEDGTMIVAENSRDKLGTEVIITVTSVLQTSAGRMVFGRLEGTAPAPRRARQRT